MNFVFGPSTKSAAMRSKNGTTVLPCVLIIILFISCPSVSCPGGGEGVGCVFSAYRLAVLGRGREV